MKQLITALLLFTSSSAFGQQNYVLNPDFETHTFCPSDYDHIKAATYWSGTDTSNPINYCTPEYCHTCAVNTYVNVPSGQFSWQYPHSGQGYAQLRITIIDTQGTGGIRDYLQGRLYKKLTAGKRYCVSFYVNLAEGSHQAIADIDVYFDNGSIDTTRNCAAAQTRYTPQVVNTLGPIIDTANWIKIEGSFIAKGTEQFLTIGNFKDNAHTTYVNMPYNSYQGNTDGTRYLIDDVSVVESDLRADAGLDTHVGKGDSIYIGRPKEVGLECTWSVLGSTAIIGTGAGIWVKPTTATSYVVTQTLCGQSKKDTVRVDVWTAGVTTINGQTQQYSLLPNPSDGRIQLQQAMKDIAPISIKVYNAVGAIVYTANEAFVGDTTSLDLSNIAPGMYNVVLHDSAGTAYTLKMVKQ